MANTSRVAGFRPVRTISGAPWMGHVRKYPVDSSNATAIFKGDAITIEDDGNCAPAAAGGILLGVCVGIEVNRSVAATEYPGYLPATTAGNILVSVGPDVLYEVEEDGVGGAMVAGNVASVGDLVAGTGSTTTGMSGHMLDSSDVIAKDASPGSAQLLVVELSSRADNAVGTSAKWIVRINESAWALGQSGL